MAQDNIKDFTVEWIIFGLLSFCLITFSIFFMVNNGTVGLDDDTTYFLNYTSTNLSSNLMEVDNEANKVLNITAQSKPDESFLGSRDSVSTSFSASKQGRNYWGSTKILISWIFAGDMGKMLIAVFSGIMGFLIFYFAYKFIRIGN